MENPVFQKITKEVFCNYGFFKVKNKYVLQLQDTTIVVNFRSWNKIRCFQYYIYINAINKPEAYLETIGDMYFELKMEHKPSAQGYHRHEILFEHYSEEEYRELLTKMLHAYFDAHKQYGLEYLKENADALTLTLEARVYLGVS